MLEHGANVNHPSDSGFPIATVRDESVAVFLHAQGADLSLTDDQGRTHLFYVQDPGVARYLIGQGLDLWHRDWRGAIALDMAANLGRCEVAEVLLTESMSQEAGRAERLVDTCDKFGYTPLHRAAGSGDMVELLIRYGADVTANTSAGTPLHWAQDEKSVKALIQHGADLNATDTAGCAPLHYAARHGLTGTIGWLTDCGTNPDIADPRGRTPLRGEAGVPASKALLDRGADVNARDKDGGTPLHLAAEEGWLEKMEWLLNRGDDCTNAARRSPLHDASRYQIAKLLIDKGANVNKRDLRRRTPLHEAADFETASLLLERGAEINAASEAGFPIATARDEKIARLLDERGADLTAISVWNRTHLFFVRDSGVARYLIRRGLDPMQQDDFKVTPLHAAARQNRREVVEVLLTESADREKDGAKRLVDMRDFEGFTPRHSALLEKNSEIAALLLARGAEVPRSSDGHEGNAGPQAQARNR